MLPWPAIASKGLGISHTAHWNEMRGVMLWNCTVTALEMFSFFSFWFFSLFSNTRSWRILTTIRKKASQLRRKAAMISTIGVAAFPDRYVFGKVQAYVCIFFAWRTLLLLYLLTPSVVENFETTDASLSISNSFPNTPMYALLNFQLPKFSEEGTISSKMPILTIRTLSVS